MAQTVTEGYSAKHIANYFLSKYMGKITPLKLQKLVYIAHGWHMAYHGVNKPLVSDENVEAWKHGPVFPSLYHHFKDFGNLTINRYAEKVEFDQDGNKKFWKSPYKKSIPQIRSNDISTINLLDRIWEVYGGYSGVYLSNLCHQQGTPWAESKSQIKNAHIANKEIEKHYLDKLNNNKNG
ncbi:MAG: DUF4065 domain-containing protein [Rhodobacteraceae bacterium]|nr:DUF4065 domain-containing protein [Paracoccaceae bacterium]MCY4251024.1 DUF4065 domain-containing protein [Paracoccaceae bacterium]MCY4307339.1 DUF4065 domain-containing protein [Paracoccaceae bacterium]